ncbi:polysaccharide lyase [Streptomyces sp. NPDC050485]|uniref:polysaccharide lyase n=1 Tax=Streptomyces sp. NPDC050485 TaxID=3365617 RepID=UPI0037A28086
MRQTVRNRSRTVLAVAAITTMVLTVSACGGSGSTGTPSSKASASAEGKKHKHKGSKAPSTGTAPKTPGPLEPAGAFSDGFERAADNGWRPTINDTTDPQRAQTSLAALEAQPNSQIRQVSSPGAPARDGGHALQMTVPHQLGSFRSEVSRGSVPMGSEDWYGFSVYLPSNWQKDPQSSILAQWHAVLNDPGKTKGNGDGSPPVSLSVAGDHWQMKLHWNTQGGISSGPGSGHKTIDLGAITPGVWTDFVLHAKWSNTSAGLVQLWKAGHQVMDYNGPIDYSAQVGPYFKLGIYHPDWKSFKKSKYQQDTTATGPIVVYDDAVRTIEGPGTYAAVAPR